MIAQRIGFVLGYILFTAIVFSIFRLTGKLPEGWSIAHVGGIIAILAMIGNMFKRYFSS